LSLASLSNYFQGHHTASLPGAARAKLTLDGRLALSSLADIATFNTPSNKKHKVSTKFSLIFDFSLGATGSFSPLLVATRFDAVTIRIWNSSMIAKKRVAPLAEVLGCQSSNK